MLSNSCLILPAVVKQQQEENSRNHVPALFAVSVLYWGKVDVACESTFVKISFGKFTQNDIKMETLPNEKSMDVKRIIPSGDSGGLMS